ncbi:MAG: Lrp/AsnC family transcriptional regulator [Chloroflexi bacterium]|nr:Lrp/AsnC family transcriptional regulator [Chloroflexota bacterium]
MEVDDLDYQLIQILQKDGRESYVNIAKKLGVVEGTIRKRVKTLVNNKIIRIIALTNPQKLGYNVLSIMGLQVQMASLRTAASILADKPNVCYLAFVTGRYDLIAMVLTRSPQELSDFIEKEISSIPSVLRTETFVNLDVIKGAWQGIDLNQLIGSNINNQPDLSII